MEYRDAVELPFTSQQLFALLADIERYPEFLPHWHTAHVLRREDNRLFVQQQLGVGPLAMQFRSTATLDAHHRLCIIGEGRALRSLRIEWSLEQGCNNRCRVALQAELQLRSGILQRPLQALFSDSHHRLMGFFERRAHSLLG